jgi:hypothetical protein
MRLLPRLVTDQRFRPCEPDTEHAYDTEDGEHPEIN